MTKAWLLKLTAGFTLGSVAATACTSSNSTKLDSSFAVGPSGGTFSSDGVTLSVPPGALSSSVTIAVTSDGLAPAGYIVQGQVYRFAPAGLQFATPISVTFPSQLVGSSLVQWSTEGSDDTTFAPITTTYDARGATAQVTHFSSGFVGSSGTGVTCISQLPTAVAPSQACVTTTLVESLHFQFTDVPGQPAGDPRATIISDSVGLRTLANVAPVLSANAGHARYTSKDPSWGTALVSGDTITSFTADVSSYSDNVTCEPMTTPVQVQCSGGNVPIGNAPDDIDGGSADDASDESDAVVDAAGAGPVCTVVATDPFTQADAAGTPYPQASFGCSLPIGGGAGSGSFQPTATVFELTKPTNFTMWEKHALTEKSLASTTELYAGCDTTVAPIAAHSYSDCRTDSTVLAPGVYTFVNCDGYLGAFTAVPRPAAVNPNTSCATAAALGTSAAAVFDGGPLYFTFKSGFSTTNLHFRSVTIQNVGAFRAEVRSVCDDATSDIVDTGVPGAYAICQEDGTVIQVSGLTPFQDYYLVLSDIDPGLQPVLSQDVEE